ncbi:MAG: biotin--[acetyl-CoA-carboxylase] ligase [Alphaproteobacteria bacterium]|nr:biotin--[acetyl-CoA-carboxylase] ligase [Alphaproteobacteria bacterium]
MGLALPAGYAARLLEEIDSTNEEARRLARAGVEGPLWIMAKTQTAGRGRRGRAWVSPPGNLMATLVMRPDCPAVAAGQLSFVAALAVADLIQGIDPRLEITLKWPNDVLVHDKKIAGILLESSSSPTGALEFLAIGIGVNLRHHPDGTPYPVTSLAAETASVPEPETALGLLAQGFDRALRMWRAHGFEPIRDGWLKRAKGVGRPVLVRLAEEELEGIFQGLDKDGALILQQPNGLTRLITAGEVFF